MLLHVLHLSQVEMVGNCGLVWPAVSKSVSSVWLSVLGMCIHVVHMEHIMVECGTHTSINW